MAPWILYWDEIKSAFRIEVGHRWRGICDTSTPSSIQNLTWRWVVAGTATPLFLLNKNRAFLISARPLVSTCWITMRVSGQWFGPAPARQGGHGENEDNYLFTLLIQGWYMNDRLNPQSYHGARL